MDPLDVVALTRELVDIDSTTGREGACATLLASRLRERGWSVHEQQVSEGRGNVIATRGPRPVLAFSTHVDCVPPFFPSRVEGDRVFVSGTYTVSQVGADVVIDLTGGTQMVLVGIQQTSLTGDWIFS